MNKESFYKLQKETYKNLADSFDMDQKRDNRNHLNKIKAINEFLDIQNGDKILEIGVGTGIHAKYILDFNLGKSFEFVGVDISEDMLIEAQKRLGELVVLKAMAGENLIFEDNFFDKIYISGSLHHFNDLELGVKEILRVLKPGGKFCIMEPNILFPTNLFAAYTKAEEVNMKLIKRSNFKKWLGIFPDIEYQVLNFAYTPPFPKVFIPFYNILDKIFIKVPFLNKISIMLFVRGIKK